MVHTTKPTNSELKAKFIAELNETSTPKNFVEGWKQDNRNKKANVFAARHEMFTELSTYEKPVKTENLLNLAIEQVKQKCMEEIKNKFKSMVIEEWRNKVMQDKVAVLNNRHQLLTEISAKKLIKELAPLKVDSGDNKGMLLAEIKKVAGQKRRHISDSELEVVPAWKEIEMAQKRVTMENKKNVVLDLTEESSKNLISNKNFNFMAKRSRVMNQIRSKPVEAWRQNKYDAISKVLLEKQQVLNQIVCHEVELNKTQDDRECLLSAIKAKNPSEGIIEAWRLQQAKQRIEAIKAKNQVNCDIYDGEGTLKKTANRSALLSEIRETVRNQKVQDAPVVESWRQTERDQKSELLISKKTFLVSIEQSDVSKLLKKNNTKYGLSQHQELMSAIRAEPLPAWKEEAMGKRVEAIQNKKAVVAEIAETQNFILENKTTIQDNKIKMMSEIRAINGNFLESWKEETYNTRATAIGAKNLINDAILGASTQLSSTKSAVEQKCAVLSELRINQEQPIPEWKEDILNERAAIFGNKHMLTCSIFDCDNVMSTLTISRPMEEIRSNLMKDLRRANPVEAWKEAKLEKMSTLHFSKKEINSLVEARQELVNFKDQYALRRDMLKQVRQNGIAMPAWKEAKYAKKLQVFDNKHQLNRCIENLEL